MKQRCPWSTDDPLYIAYHDEEWGVPVYDERNITLKFTYTFQVQR